MGEKVETLRKVMTEKERKEALNALRAKLYNPELVKEADRLAQEARKKGSSFNAVENEKRMREHPLFSKLHLLDLSED